MTDVQVVKIIIVGDANVGKTSLLTQYCLKTFDQYQSPTIGCDFSTKLVTRNRTNQLKLQLWDVAGQEKFQSISKLFIRGAQGCVILSDITNKESLNSTISWKNLVSACVDNIPIFLVQNKIDLIAEQSNIEEFQTIDYLKQFTRDHQFQECYQLSVKLNANDQSSDDKIYFMFKDLVESMIEKGTLDLKENLVKNTFLLSSEAPKKDKKQCC